MDVVADDAEKCIEYADVRDFEALASIRYQLSLQSHQTVTSTEMPLSNHRRL